MHRPIADITPLSHLGVLAVRGVEARKFLGGQLSQDVLALAADRVELAGLHSPQGRVLALLRLVAQGPNDVLCVLPRELLTDTLALLRKFLLRAKTTLSDESALWHLEGLANDSARGAAVAGALPPASMATLGSAARASPHAGEGQSAGEVQSSGEAQNTEIICWRHAPDGRLIRLRAATGEAGPSAAADSGAALRAWQLADIVVGIPDITLATRGEFVAQMLNLDVLGGISFTKGCYTGQEVIARAHYRGRVKRRVQRFQLAPSSLPTPGDKLELEVEVGGTRVLRSAQVVNAVAADEGIECLAVAIFAEAEPAPAEPAPAESAPAESAPARGARAMPMGYSLPD